MSLVNYNSRERYFLTWRLFTPALVPLAGYSIYQWYQTHETEWTVSRESFDQFFADFENTKPYSTAKLLAIKRRLQEELGVSDEELEKAASASHDHH